MRKSDITIVIIYHHLVIQYMTLNIWTNEIHHWTCNVFPNPVLFRVHTAGLQARVGVLPWCCCLAEIGPCPNPVTYLKRESQGGYALGDTNTTLILLIILHLLHQDRCVVDYGDDVLCNHNERLPQVNPRLSVILQVHVVWHWSGGRTGVKLNEIPQVLYIIHLWSHGICLSLKKYIYK